MANPHGVHGTYRRRYRLVDFAMEEDGPLLSIGQVASVLGISDQIMRELADAGDIRAVRIGRDRRVVWRSFRAYLFATNVLPLAENELPVVRKADGSDADLRHRVIRLEQTVRGLQARLDAQTPTINAITCVNRDQVNPSGV